MPHRMRIIHNPNAYIHGRAYVYMVHKAIVLSLHPDSVFSGGKIIQMGYDEASSQAGRSILDRTGNHCCISIPGYTIYLVPGFIINVNTDLHVIANIPTHIMIIMACNATHGIV